MKIISSPRSVTVLKLFVMLILAAILLTLAGCRPAVEPEPPAVEEPEAPPEEAVPSEEDQESEPLEAKGRYVGFADARSLEIELVDSEHDFMVFQLSQKVQDQLDNNEPEPGTPVVITFTLSSQGQPVIESLEVE